ncbi:MAG: hypothetical protein M0P64_02865 [Candidatus Pacebacteria bacterium]|jgi:hypothetical protein|nr:hypothetical protein [Candidatus Paceibacterota bacterium]
MTNTTTTPLTLSVYPTSRGYAYVLFEGPFSPVDWGIKDVRKKDKNDCTLKGIKKLIDEYRPDYLIIEDHAEIGSRRSSRIRRLYRSLAHLAESEEVEVVRYSKEAIRSCFEPEGARTKYDIAKAIAREIPALAHRLPRLRKIWMSEDPRQSLFDAAALGVVFYIKQSTRAKSLVSPL